MNYDKIILELLDRIKTLEEKVAELEGRGNKVNNTVDLNEDDQDYFAPKQGSYTDKACAVIENAISKAKQEGKETVIIVANDLQRAVGLKNRMPLCCNAMRKVAANYRAQVVADTPSHNSSTYAIKYWVK